MPNTITLVFSLLVAIVILATVATRFRLPYAIVLVLAGLLLGFIHPRHRGHAVPPSLRHRARACRLTARLHPRSANHPP